MSYKINEMFVSLQGEGLHTGAPAVFCRFSGCNLACAFCDTRHQGGSVYARSSLVDTLRELGPGQNRLVLTGGEPALQLDEPLLADIRDAFSTLSIETNGTLPLPLGLDWVCVSPKTRDLLVTSGDELKLPFPLLPPEWFEALDFRYFFLQPIAGKNLQENTQRAVEYCLRHPQWRVSVQTHKFLGLR